MNRPLTWVVILGTLPGLGFGALIRVKWLPVKVFPWAGKIIS
jgi:hypothetical protein